MSISCVVIDLKNKLNLLEFETYIKNLCGEGNEIIYCSSVRTDSNGVRNYVFEESECPEKIINTVIKKCSQQNILIIRDVDIYKNAEKLVKALKKNNQVVAFKKKNSKFKNFIFKLFNATIGRFYMKDLHLIDHGIILYGEIASRVLKTVSYPSVLCKTNNWTGINIVQLDGQESNYKFKYNFGKSIISTIAPFFVAMVMLIVKLVGGFKLFLTLEILYWAIFLLAILVGFVFASKWLVKSLIGENVKDTAKFL